MTALVKAIELLETPKDSYATTCLEREGVNALKSSCINGQSAAKCRKGKGSETIPVGSTPDYRGEAVALFYFYILLDPIDNKPKYVGRTVNQAAIISRHISESKKRKRSSKDIWVVSLLRKNKKPILKVIYKEATTEKHSLLIEKMLIKKIGRRFPLKNDPENKTGAISTGKPVFQYSLDGKYITSFDNANRAFKETGVKDSNILRCCKKPNGYGVKSAGGFLWSFNKYKKYPHNYKRGFSTKKTIQYTLSGSVVAEYESQRIASRKTGVSYKKISSACIGKQKTAGGFVWKTKQ